MDVKIKDTSNAVFFQCILQRKLHYEVSLIKIKEQVDMSTVGSHGNADCLLNTRHPNVTKKFSIKKSSILILSVSENVLFKSRVILFKVLFIPTLDNRLVPFLFRNKSEAIF